MIVLSKFREVIAVLAKAGLLGQEISDKRSLHLVSPNPKRVLCDLIDESEGDLLLIAFRIEIESRLRALATRLGGTGNSRKTKSILRHLLLARVLNENEYAALKRLISILNHTAIGTRIDPGIIELLIQVRPLLLTTLHKRPLPPDLSIFGL